MRRTGEHEEDEEDEDDEEHAVDHDARDLLEDLLMRLDWKNWLRSPTSRSSGSVSDPAASASPAGFPRRRPVILVCVLLALVLAIGGTLSLRAAHGTTLNLVGLPNDGKLGAQLLRTGEFEVAGAEGDKLKGTKVTLDGKPLRTRAAHGSAGALSVGLGDIKDGTHELRVTHPGSWPTGDTEVVRKLTVDTEAPRLKVADTKAKGFREPVTVRGTAADAQRITVAGHTAKPAKDGAFAVRLPRPPGRTTVTATDAAGNTARHEAELTVHRPLLKAVHVSAQGWASDALREPVMKMLKQKKINAVQLDIKDELGEVGYASKVPLAKSVGAAKGYYDAKKAVKEIHAAGGTVVGRIVAFRDPILATKSWKSGHRDRVVRTPGGGAYNGGSYGQLSFTNFANKEVRQYNIDLAAEAAKLGFDDILYDYIRRPDGPIRKMSFPGLGDTTPERSVADVVGETRAAVRKHNAFLGVSVFGIAVDRPKEIAQDVGLLAQEADYISPMIYPSHWAKGEYGVSDPNSHPYPITKRSLAAFAKKTRHTDAQIVPWIQDFSLGVSYGDKEVRAQLDAARSDGIKGFLLWNPGVQYHEGALG
ncbi:putative glycoside hydrolase [Streptomyces sp. NBC_01016]|uniref:putative glycoside hydrolase n=1 Tax=Streptomyces sp. NBC_01016 TaxID=2903720 RepID=UPI002251A36A|nr:putative glycoside hydrolase [Streptomyces sp. NBC_01016]MCX4830968.1 putative glycoside hydrolase [Streptomyces sp. NBC_01016]